jgi:hypothetical protein
MQTGTIRGSDGELPVREDASVPEAGIEVTWTFEPLLPPAMAAKAEAVGVAKAGTDSLSLFVLAVLAGRSSLWEHPSSRRSLRQLGSVTGQPGF